MKENKFPYSLKKPEKDPALTRALTDLTKYHMDMCPSYKKILDSLKFDPDKTSDFRDIPPLPAGVFKRLRLASIDPDSASGIKTLTSSGTSGQLSSMICLDGETRSAQQRALAEIVAAFIGENRLPMLIIDCPGTVKSGSQFSARAAGILGFSLFARKRVFALNDDLSLNTAAVNDFMAHYGNAPFLVFGFTFLIWQNFYLQLKDLPERPDMKNAIMIHGGGWKKLQNLNISKDEFKSALYEAFNISRIHDYYGMAEQAGSIFMECECGRLHCSDYSDVLIRRAKDFSLCDIGEKGIIQVLSTLPKSYPGHIILTEDEGVLLGVDDCPCGRPGTTFDVTGRLEKAVIRGCSDVY